MIRASASVNPKVRGAYSWEGEALGEWCGQSLKQGVLSKGETVDLEYWERRPNGKEQHFAWVSDLPIEESTVGEMMRAGRARWRIENETFNTLKNQGYHFEHNFGHGHKHLATVFAYLMMLAFLLDQVQQRCCTLFAKAQAKAERARYF